MWFMRRGVLLRLLGVPWSGIVMARSDQIAVLKQLVQTEIRQAREQGAVVDLGEDIEFLSFAIGKAAIGKAQLSQDAWVLFETREQRGGYFVEFGAGDGMLLSNTYLLEKSFGWNGTLAEPNPVFHDRLSRNRDCFISRKCVAASTGQKVPFLQATDPHLSSMERYASLDFHAAERANGAKIFVETQSLEDLLSAARAPRAIDYLSLDTEGSELEILSAFDFDKFDVRLITVEHNHTARRGEIYQLLSDKGFERKFANLTEFDDWYVNTRISSTNRLRVDAGLTARGSVFRRALRRLFRQKSPRMS
jgi:FkbM family methyltransferase